MTNLDRLISIDLIAVLRSKIAEHRKDSDKVGKSKKRTLASGASGRGFAEIRFHVRWPDFACELNDELTSP